MRKKKRPTTTFAQTIPLSERIVRGEKGIRKCSEEDTENPTLVTDLGFVYMVNVRCIKTFIHFFI